MPPKDQTNLINLLFEEFRRNFRHFFNPCEQGFINEAIIWMFTRRFKRQPRSMMIFENGVKMTELCFITAGTFGLYNKKQRNPTDPLPPFVVLPRHRVYGDYQILYDLYPTMDFRTYIKDDRHEQALDRVV